MTEKKSHYPRAVVEQAVETLEAMTTLTSKRLRDKCPALLRQLRAALAEPQLCAHRHAYFGDQKSRRCIDCDTPEPQALQYGGSL